VDIYIKEAFPGEYLLVTTDRLTKSLELLSAGDFDVILCDLSLPDSYGMKTFDRIKAACRDIPVIVLTGYGDDSFGKQAVSNGAADFIHKNNIDSNLLKRSIVYSIERSNLQRQLIAHGKTIEESEKKYRSLFEESKNPIYVCVPGGMLKDFNHAAEDVFGYSREELLKINVNELFVHAEEKDRLKLLLERDGSVRDFEVVFRKKDGSQLTCLLASSIRKDENDNLIYQGIVHDITERRKVQELQKAKELAEQTSRTRQEFLSVMSHEIRTPLNAVIGITELLINEKPKKNQLRNLNLLKFSARNLLGLVNNVLDFSKIDAGKIQFEKNNFNVHVLLRTIVESFRPRTEEKNLKFELVLDGSIPEIVKGDSMRLNQILDNLIGNAIKFTSTGEIILTAKKSSTAVGSIRLVFEVSDTGIGIDKNRHEEIFQSFSQAYPHTARMYGGTGLGLAISRRLVELMGGTIEVESEAGKGSIFRFDVPFQEAEAAADRPGETPAMPVHVPALDGKNILLVEDNPTNSELTRKFILKWGAYVDCAENGKVAVEKIRKKKYDLVLMDLHMPEMDGYEATRTIRSMGHSPEKLPIIALTAYTMDEDEPDAFRAGMNDYVSKPIDTQELQRKIVENLGRNGKAFSVMPAASADVLTLDRLIESFRHDPEFIKRYLDIFGKEFEQLPVHVRKLSAQKDLDSLSVLIHKATPSLQRLEHTMLYDRLYHLKKIVSENDSSADDLEKIIHDIEQSCEEIAFRIQTLKSEYLA